jgi:hypothetical protein
MQTLQNSPFCKKKKNFMTGEKKGSHISEHDWMQCNRIMHWLPRR